MLYSQTMDFEVVKAGFDTYVYFKAYSLIFIVPDHNTHNAVDSQMWLVLSWS